VISRGRVSSRDLGAIVERLPIVFAAGIRAFYDQKGKRRRKNQTKGEPEKSVERARRTRRR
jgi:hypothetical protein